MSRRTRLVTTLAVLATALLPTRFVLASEAVVIDGSSTVYPISLAAAELYHEKTGTAFEINVSGTTGGMRLFTSGKLALTGASRPIRKDEIDACASAGIAFVEVPIALDGLTIAVGAQNSFVDAMTMAELKTLWEPGSTVTTWNQVRASWPAVPIALYGPGRSHGTFDYFTEVVNGKALQIRDDWTGSDDFNELVQALVVNGNALGYFGLSYYLQNKGQLRAVPIDAGHGPVAPSRETVLNGTYVPFSRPLFYYVTLTALDRPEIRGYLESVLNAPKVVNDSGYVALNDDLLAIVRRRLSERVTGSLFQNVTGRPRLAEVYQSTAPATPAPAPVAVAPAPEAPKPVPAPVVAVVPPTPAVPPAAPVAPVVSSVPAAPVVVAPKPALSPADLERLRTASFALARASLQKQPDAAELKRLGQEVAALAGSLP